MAEISTTSLESIPEPDGERPIGGHAHLLDLDAPIESMGNLARELGPIYKLKFAGDAELVVVSSQELIEELCDETRFDKMVSGALYKIRDFAKDGLFTAHTREENWVKAHQLLLPAFSMGSMEDYFPMMLDVSEQLCSRWERLNSSDEVDVPDEMVRLTLEVIGLCGFDYRFDSFGREQAHPFVEAMGMCLGEAMARSVRIPLFTKLAVGRNRAYEDGIEYMNSVVDTVIKERKETGRVGEVGDLLDLMLASQSDPATGLTDENIRYQIITFLIAGHETTSGLLAFTINHLLKHPAVMTRARAEVDRVLGHDLSSAPTLREVSGLSYIRQVLNESLRLHPTAPAMQLTPYEDTVLGGRYAVKKRLPILALTTQLHRDREVWGENAHLFNPENFTPAKEKERPPHSFKPFGNGQRACIGSQFAMQESTLIIGMMLQRFNLIDHTNYQLKVKETLTFKPDNFRLQVRARTAADREEVLEVTDRQIHEATNTTLALAAGHDTPLTVLYGSNMGSARQIAQRLVEEGTEQGYAVTLKTLDEAVDALPVTGTLLVVCASYNGQPPDNAAAFFNWLETQSQQASSNSQVLSSELQFAVLGVGNKDWALTYQQVPRLLDEWLDQLGASRLLPRGEADARSDFFGQVDDYLPAAWSASASHFDLVASSGSAGGSNVAQRKTRYRVDELHEHSTAIAHFPDMQPFEVLENRQLAVSSEAYGESKHHLSLRLPEGVAYKTGDHLLVMPSNRESLVKRVADRFGYEPNQQIAVMRNSPGDDPLPVGEELSVAELLTHYIELQDPMSLRILKRLIEFIECPNRRAEAQSLVDDSDRFEKEITEPKVSLLQYLEAAPECALPFELFLEFVAPARPRYYSISSSSLVEPRSLDISISVLRNRAGSKGKTAAGSADLFEGACSVYLSEREVGRSITARVRSVDSHFLPPADLSTPIIMIGPGTGVAPFRGFMQDRMWHRQRGVADLGAALLFFGCRHPDADFMYREEMERWNRDGLVDLSVAFSRLGDSALPDAEYHQVKGYVQHAVEARGEEIWKLLDKGAIIYVCGDASGMLPAVKQALVDVAQTHGVGSNAKELAPSGSDADAWLTQLERDSRFLVDAWA